MRIPRNIAVTVCALLTLISTSSPLHADEQTSPWRIVNYWSWSCAPCRIEVPELNEFSKTLTETNIIIVGVNFDEDPRDKTLEIAARMGIEFDTLTQAQVDSLNLTAPHVLPTTYILAPDNTVRAKLVGAQDQHSLQQELELLGLAISAESTIP